MSPFGPWYTNCEGDRAKGRPLHFGGHDRGRRGIFHDRGIGQGPRDTENGPWQQDESQCQDNGREHRSGGYY